MGTDFLGIDTLLTDDERLVRDNTRKFIEDNLIPIIEQCNREGRFPRELDQADGRARILRRQPQGLRLRRDGQRRVRPDDAGARARRPRRAQLRQRAVGARHVSHLHLRQRRPEETTGCPAWPRARSSAASASPSPTPAPTPAPCARARAQDRRRLHPQRREDVDHLRLHRRRRRHLGEGRETTAAASAASSSKPTAPASSPTTSTASGRCAPPSPPAFPCRTSGFPPRTCCPKSDGLKSPLMCLNQARYGIAWGAIGAAMACYDMRTRSTRSSASSSTTCPSPATSSCRKSSSG